MTYVFTPADVRFLRSSAGVSAVAAVSGLPLTSASYLADVATARRLLGDQAGMVLETVLLRRRAAAKVDSPEDWFFTDTALQQATPMPVARHRATRFAGRSVHDVTCSVGVDLAALAEVADRCVGSDLDEVRLAMAAHNVSAPLVRADALRPVTRHSAIFVDPARRDSAGRRRWHAADFVPPLDQLADAYPGRDLAVKCAPGMDFAELPWTGEVELVSLDGQVREACLWTGAFAGPPRRATVLRTGSPMWTVTSGEPDDCPVREAGEWLVDPDGAVVRAGLVRQYAARLGFGQLDERIAYLTGDTKPDGIRAFRVLEHGHYTEKSLRQTLRRRGVGRLEILVRGLDVDPNTLRPRLKLSGREAATVVLTRVGRTPMAYVCVAS
ncbi:MAG: class I SAM-dependent methyltransferase [Actinophytocola sp.]|uniref:THUMP-like domain-containing protein n=1 Tax=Actinophytocola sp. TaxID=1872138 RepID=UPI003C78743B